MLIKGSLDEIYSFFLGQRLENEYQKWYQLLLNQESHFKINLNLQRKDSLISNISNNYNNNAINRTNTKEMNRMGFNNFDEVVDDNILNENNNITVSPIINDKIDKINTFLEMNNGSKEISYNKNENINENIDDKNEYINLINQKIKLIYSFLSSIFSLKKMIIFKDNIIEKLKKKKVKNVIYPKIIQLLQ